MQTNLVQEEFKRKPKKLSNKAIESLISDSFKKHADRVEIPMMDLGKIFDWGRRALREGDDLDTEMQRAIRMYRVN